MTLKQTANGRVKISTTHMKQIDDNGEYDYEEEMERRRARRKKKIVRIATLYGMNSTARLPTASRRKKRKNKKKDLQKRRMQEAEEKDRHKYSYLLLLGDTFLQDPAMLLYY